MAKYDSQPFPSLPSIRITLSVSALAEEAISSSSAFSRIDSAKEGRTTNLATTFLESLSSYIPGGGYRRTRVCNGPFFCGEVIEGRNRLEGTG